MAMLSFETKSGGSYACSGSLLAGGQYVLTAAHCFYDLTGKYFTNASVSAAPLRAGAAANAVFVHPGYRWDKTPMSPSSVFTLPLVPKSVTRCPPAEAPVTPILSGSIFHSLA